MRRVLAMVTVTALMLAACGGGDGNGTPAGGTASVVQASATRSGAATGTSLPATAQRGTATAPGPSGTATRVSTRTAGTPSAPAQATPTTRPATSVSTPRPIATATSPQTRPTPTNTTAPTATRPPDATPTPTEVEVVITPGGDDAIALLDIGFGQEDGSEEVGYGFVIRNTSGATLDYSEYDIVAYDADGKALERDFGYIDLLLPGETRGIGGSIYVPEGTVAAKVEVQVISGDPTTTDFTQPFSTSNPTYYGEEFFPIVTAIITSPYNRPVEDIDVNVVLYNAAGRIIGGGYTFVDFVLPGQPAAAEVYVAGAGDPARIDVYAAPSTFSLFAGAYDAPGNQPIVVQSGWGGQPDGFDTGYGALVENPNTGVAVDTLRYQAIAYDADGRVLTVDSSYLAALFPNERFGIGGSLYPPEGTTVARVDVQVLAQNFKETSQGNPLTVSDVAFTDEVLYVTVTGTVTNALGVALESVETHAIAFNANGDIIGGGWSFADEPAPAGGTTLAEVLITTSEPPAHVELYATVSDLSEVVP